MVTIETRVLLMTKEEAKELLETIDEDAKGLITTYKPDGTVEVVDINELKQWIETD
jgi:hypothetical protein